MLSRCRKFIRGVRTAILLLLAGCSNQAVTEDRSVNYSADGRNVGFQHGEEGVFVATGEGGALEKIFDPAEGSIAVSSPLWSPVDERLIFTSARSAHQDDHQIAHEIAAWDAHPTGRSFWPEDIVYTCWLQPATGERERPPPVALFEAKCDHWGYVAANLAVRWHPSGRRVLFVDQTSSGQHSLFEFDPATRRMERIIEHSAHAVIFDLTPNHSHLICMLASEPAVPEVDGIWLRPIAGATWWRVPHSENFAKGTSDSLLERLRATRPVWTNDDQRLAFVVRTEALEADDEQIDRHAILIVDLASREIRKLYEDSGYIRDMAWHPRSHRLGFVHNNGHATLRLIDEIRVVSSAVTPANVRRFVGWNRDGTRLAYITPEPIPDPMEHWAFLFPPVPESRDLVYVGDGDGAQAGRLVHSGVRITFSQWSPTDDALSLWGTYTPTHRSWLSTFLPWTLRAGDPAAILDCTTGEMRWMAVNAHEEAQVGHYYLLIRDYERAWPWYTKSIEKRQPAGPIKLTEVVQFLRQLRIHQDSSVFEYFCLTGMGRHEEAAERLRQFRQSMVFDIEDVSGLPRPVELRDDQWLAEVRRIAAFVTPFVQNAYITEVFLSLDAAADGASFFEQELAAAATDAERLACVLCLSQLLLLLEDWSAYADLATHTLMPLLLEMDQADDFKDFHIDLSQRVASRQVEQFTALVSGGLALLPMMSVEFVGKFEEHELRAYRARWHALRNHAENAAERRWIDLVLLPVVTQLGLDDERQAIEERIKDQPLDEFLLLDESGSVNQWIEQLRSVRS